MAYVRLRFDGHWHWLHGVSSRTICNVEVIDGKRFKKALGADDRLCEYCRSRMGEVYGKRHVPPRPARPVKSAVQVLIDPFAD